VLRALRWEGCESRKVFKICFVLLSLSLSLYIYIPHPAGVSSLLITHLVLELGPGAGPSLSEILLRSEKEWR